MMVSGAKKSKQSNSAVLKRRNACSLEWNFSELKKRLPLVRNSDPEISASASPRQQLTHRDDKKEKQQFIPSPREANKTGGVKIRELKDDEQEDEKYSSVSGTDVESVGPDLSDGFLTDDFEDTDDDLLSQLWNSCKREDALLDDAPLSKQRRAGPTTTALIYVNTTTVAEKGKPDKSKENRPTKKSSSAKKSKVREAQIVSKFMKKREDGWRD
ncbi:hypothetical protein R1flu_025187 [Riccia fluitans]|uniref:Uncharacterized protein n=1 Tax=Riccia fluitans TaxID=41844 RepID=A0ABD1XXE8_9MARC